MSSDSIFHYHDLLICRSIKAATGMTGIGVAFIIGLLNSISAGWMGEFISGFEGEYAKSLKMAAYTALSMIIYWFLFIILYSFLWAPYVTWKEQKIKLSELNPDNPPLPIKLNIREWHTISSRIEEKEHFSFNDLHTEAVITHTFAKEASVNTEIRLRVYDHSGVKERIFRGKPIKLSITESEPFDLFVTTVVAPKSSHPKMIQTGNKWYYRSFCKASSDLNDEIYDHPIASNLFCEFDFTFFVEGFRPFCKTFFLSEQGNLVQKKPDVWPDIATMHMCGSCGFEHMVIPKRKNEPNFRVYAVDDDGNEIKEDD